MNKGWNKINNEWVNSIVVNDTKHYILYINGEEVDRRNSDSKMYTFKEIKELTKPNEDWNK